MKYSDFKIANEAFITDEMRNAKSIGGLIKAIKNRKNSPKENNKPNYKSRPNADELHARYKKEYNIDLTEIEDGKYNDDQARKLIFSDIKMWLSKLKRDPNIKSNIEDAINTYFGEPIDTTVGKILKATYFTSDLDYDGELAEIGHGDQEENTIITSQFCYPLAEMLELKWKNYIRYGNVGTGDGDEGCLYFTIKED